jgi:uncharacterized UBP type Zn finger protein
MTRTCSHLNAFQPVRPKTDGCEECLKTGGEWVHLRICRVCGHVGCCDQSPGHHATKHFHVTQHPVMESYDPPEGWGWCYVDEVTINLEGDVTPHPPGWIY